MGGAPIGGLQGPPSSIAEAPPNEGRPRSAISMQERGPQDGTAGPRAPGGALGGPVSSSERGGEGIVGPFLKPAYPLMTCYKCFEIDFPYFGLLAGKVEAWVVASMREQLLVYHRKAIACMDRW